MRVDLSLLRERGSVFTMRETKVSLAVVAILSLAEVHGAGGHKGCGAVCWQLAGVRPEVTKAHNRCDPTPFPRVATLGSSEPFASRLPIDLYNLDPDQGARLTTVDCLTRAVTQSGDGALGKKQC